MFKSFVIVLLSSVSLWADAVCTFADQTGSCSVTEGAVGSLSLTPGPVPDASVILANYPQYQSLILNTAYGLQMSLTGQGEFDSSFTLPSEYANWLVYGELAYDLSQALPNEGSIANFQMAGDTGQFDQFAEEPLVFLVTHNSDDPVGVQVSIDNVADANAVLYLELLADAPATHVNAPEPQGGAFVGIGLIGLIVGGWWRRFYPLLPSLVARVRRA
jgi:hypothetical protein